MCNPVIGIGLGLAALQMASTFKSMQEQKEMAKKQASLQRQQAILAEQAAAKARELDMAALEAQETQKKTEASTEKFERIRQAAQEAAALRLASAEAGVFGNSIFRLIAGTKLQEQYDIGIIEANKKNELEQIKRQKQNVEATFEGRMNEAAMQKKQAKLTKKSVPSGLSSALNILGSGVEGFMKGYSAGSELGFNTSKKK